MEITPCARYGTQCIVTTLGTDDCISWEGLAFISELFIFFCFATNQFVFSASRQINNFVHKTVLFFSYLVYVNMGQIVNKYNLFTSHQKHFIFFNGNQNHFIFFQKKPPPKIYNGRPLSGYVGRFSAFGAYHLISRRACFFILEKV